MSERVLYESHCHTPLCKHALGDPTEYVAIAERRGLKGIIFTCHAPLPGGHSSHIRMAPEEFGRYVQMIELASAEWNGRMDVRLGLESDYFPGIVPWLKELHDKAPLNHVLGSVHYHTPEYRKEHFTGDIFLFQQLYFDHLAEAAESGLYDTLAHPDLVKNEEPEEWIMDRIQPYIERSLDRIAATGVAMELNTSGLNKTLPEMNPGPIQLALMRERNIPVVIGSDAHRPERVGDNFDKAIGLLQAAGYTEASFFLDRQRQTVPLDAALAALHEI